MRLVTWTSQPGIARNWETIQGFGADVLTVQECEPDTPGARARTIKASPSKVVGTGYFFGVDPGGVSTLAGFGAWLGVC